MAEDYTADRPSHATPAWCTGSPTSIMVRLPPEQGAGRVPRRGEWNDRLPLLVRGAG